MVNKRIKQKTTKRKALASKLKKSVNEVTHNFKSAGVYFKQYLPKSVSPEVTPEEFVAGSLEDLLKDGYFDKYRHSPEFSEFRLVGIEQGLFMLTARIKNNNFAVGYVAQRIIQ